MNKYVEGKKHANEQIMHQRRKQNRNLKISGHT